MRKITDPMAKRHVSWKIQARWDKRTQKENPKEKPQTKRGDFDFAQL